MYIHVHTLQKDYYISILVILVIFTCFWEQNNNFRILTKKNNKKNFLFLSKYVKYVNDIKSKSIKYFKLNLTEFQVNVTCYFLS